MLELIYFLRNYGMRNRGMHVFSLSVPSYAFQLYPSVFRAHTHHSCQAHLTSELMTMSHFSLTAIQLDTFQFHIFGKI